MILRNINKLTAFFLVLLFAAPFAAQTERQKFRPSDKAFKWADKQLKKMTVDEKVGQIVHIGINARYLNQESPEYKELERQIVENKVGGITVFVGGVYETVHLVNRMQEAAKIPLLISADFETGVGMRFDETINFPWNMAIAATGNIDFARRQGEITAREARALGVQWNFAPTSDVNNNADNPVINVRSYGENSEEVARFASAFMSGLQSQNVLATAKHFPGHGDTAVDSHRGLPIINLPKSRLEQIELVPFKSLIDNGVGSIMIAHISLPQIDPTEVKPLKESIKASYTESEVVSQNATIPSTLSPVVVSGMLRKELGFDGLIVTDAMDMSGLTIYFNQDEAAVRAVLAGADVILKPANTDAAIRGIKEAVASGRISQERLNESARKVLAWKYQLGLTEQKITPIEQIDRIVSNPQTRQLSDEIASAAMTLVKDEGKTLPLSKGRKAVVLCITNGEDRFSAGNTFAGELRRLGLNTERIVIDERSTAKEVQEAIEKAKNAEIVVAGLFGRVRSGAKNSVGLPETGAQVLKTVLRNNPNTINVSFGNPYLLRGFPEMKTYAVAYGDMTSLQRAAARALMGEIDFKGKLPITVGSYPRGTGIVTKTVD
ncbi:MAG TPA: glycoside hydrolase family 3 N-terminal domain-containing protein [Pyrinomonadaceae bacterium]|nr:glycoside hydrolase family 3 N-terminal domain-containing protein [Pyrinomonadaceae bacterium]